jgi:DNA-binding transcriptional ArsR family regulator
MRAGTIVAGIIVLFLGLAGFAELRGDPVLPFSLAIISVYLTPIGTLVLFMAITVIGLGLIVVGLVTSEPKVVAEREVLVAQPVGSRVVYETLSELDLAILRYHSQGKNAHEISRIIGVDHLTVTEKMAKLRALGYLTEKDALTEKGYEALRRTEPPTFPRPT